MYMISRILKPIAVALIMFMSLHYLGLSVLHSLLASLIPLIFGWLNILTEVGYLSAAIVMIAAVGWAVTPADVKSVVRVNIQLLVDDVKNGDTVTTSPSPEDG